MDVTAVLLPLLGVALGTVGTLTGQYLATRGETRRHATERAAATRAELKDAIVAYLDAVQSVEQLIDTGTGRADVDDLLHAMWLRKKVLELLSDDPLAHTAHRYTSTLHDLATATAEPAAHPLAPTSAAASVGAGGGGAGSGTGATGMPIPTSGVPGTRPPATAGIAAPTSPAVTTWVTRIADPDAASGTPAASGVSNEATTTGTPGVTTWVTRIADPDAASGTPAHTPAAGGVSTEVTTTGRPATTTWVTRTTWPDGASGAPAAGGASTVVTITGTPAVTTSVTQIAGTDGDSGTVIAGGESTEVAATDAPAATAGGSLTVGAAGGGLTGERKRLRGEFMEGARAVLRV